MRNIFNSKLSLLLCMVVLVSAAYSFYYHDRPRVDAEAYDAIAWNLVQGYGYVEQRSNADNPAKDDAVVRVGPGYEFFLAALYKVFGHHIWVVWIFQALLRGFSVLLVYNIARFLFPTEYSLSLAAAGIFGFAPDLIVVNGLLLTETLFLFLFLYSVYLTLSVFQNESTDHSSSSINLLYVGAFWALTILVRPVAILPFLLVLMVFLWQRHFFAIAAVFLPALFLISPWSYYMSTRHDAFILTTTAGGLDLWVGNNPDATGGFVKTPEIQEVRNNNHSVEFSRIAWGKYVEFITDEPLLFLELQWRKAAIYLSLIRPTGFWIHLMAYPGERLLTLLFSGAYTLFLLVFGIAGAFQFFRERRDTVSRLFMAIAVLQPLAVIPFIVETRYRYALFPFLAVFTVFFWVHRPLSKRILGTVICILLLCTAYDVWYNWEDIINKINMAIPI